MKQHLAHILAPSYRTLLFLLAAGMFLFSCKEDIKLSSEASMTTLTLTVGDKDYKVTFTDKEGTITVPYSTNLSDGAVVKVVTLSAKATGVKAGEKVTISATGIITLTVTAEDKKTKETYTVTVAKADPSSEAAIRSLTLTVGSTDYEIDFTDRAYTLILSAGATLPSAVGVKQIELSIGATSDAGDELSVTDNTVTITVTAADGETTQEYTVTVENAEPLSSEAAIMSLTLTVGDTDYEIMFTGTQDTLKVGPLGTSVPATFGVKNIALSSGATTDAGDQLSVTNNAVTITVTAEDKMTTQEYRVVLGFTTVGITSFTFEVPDNESMALDTADRKRIVGKIDHQAGTITFDQQSAYVYRDKLKATFEVSEEGAAVQAAGVTQESGVTEQDFTSPVSYVVRARGGTETTYRVTLLKSTMATIPNARFRAKLKDFVPTAFTGDQLDITHNTVVNNNGTLDVGNQTPELTSLKGIEFFTSLDTLNFLSNSVRFLDVSKNTALTYLNCNNNDLDSLDVSKNTALTYLGCGANYLTSLDVTVNTALITLSCYRNSLPSLDVSANTALMELSCGSNSLTSLDVSTNTALMRLNCSSNSLTSLDVRENTALEALACYDNSLTSLDMTGMRSIRELYIGTGKGTNNNPLLATLRVNTAVQDFMEIITMKTNRGANLTITTVNNDGQVVCNDYTPADPEGNCN